MDKTDVVDAIIDELDDRAVEGLGHVLASADHDDMWGTIILQIVPEEGGKPENFRVRVTRLRERAE